MRLGRVRVSHSYVVDMDDQGMVDEAREALMEDMSGEEMRVLIEAVEDPEVTEGDIPDFLKEGNEEG